MPLIDAGKQVNVTYQLFKSLNDYDNKAQSFVAKQNSFFNFSNITGNIINAYYLVSAKLCRSNK